jgi:hypothetical protein
MPFSKQYILVSAYNFELLLKVKVKIVHIKHLAMDDQTKNCREKISTISKMLPGTEGSGGIPQENPWKNFVCAIDRPCPFAYTIHNKV